MGIKSKNQKPDWKPGKDMPEFSGSSWKELNDLWPAEIRIHSDAYKIIALAFPAFIVTKEFMKTLLNGEFIGYQEFLTLFWIHRCEEMKAGIATESWPVMKGMNVGGTLWYARKAKITRLGLIENLPISRVRLYRVTGLGKILMKHYIDQLEQANRNLRYWVSLQPDHYAHNVTKYLDRYWPGWDNME